jgi:Cell wall-active antibiotics response LiaF, C-terminal
METTQDNLRANPGVGAALAAFAIFLALMVGSYVYWQGGEGAEMGASGGTSDAPRIEAVAVMGLHEEKNTSQDFRHAETACVMARNVIDLRQADIQGKEAVIENFVLMGRTEILVPEDWTVVTKGITIMGGVENSTRRDKANPSKRLKIEGLVLMGAISIGH